MSEQVIGNLTNGVSNATVSRKRALQLIGGALAVAAPASASQVPQSAEAGKQRKPPEAFAVATLSNPTAVDGTTFRFEIQLADGEQRREDAPQPTPMNALIRELAFGA